MKTISLLTIVVLFLFGCTANTAKYFQWAQQKDTIDEYKSFLEKFPNSPEAPKARIRLEELEYVDAKKTARYSQLERFVNVYPTSSFNDSIKLLMSKFKLLKIDKDTLFNWQSFDLKRDGEPDCICQISSSIAVNDEEKKAFGALLVKMKKLKEFLLIFSVSSNNYRHQNQELNSLGHCIQIEKMISSYSKKVY